MKKSFSDGFSESITLAELVLILKLVMENYLVGIWGWACVKN